MPSSSVRPSCRSRAVLAAALTLAATAPAEGAFVTFESGPTRPLALSPDGTKLFAANIPDGRLEVFDVVLGGVNHALSIPVGMEPVAVAARTDDEVWVVNHLSDSVSIVDVSQGRVVRTLLVGDEPRDIVFAGPGKSRAFITTAHRGQHRVDASISGVSGAGDPQLQTAGVARADVWVFDATSPGTTIGGTPLKIIELFGDTPRALAASDDGSTVYAAVFKSGNQTTTVTEGAVCNGFGSGSCGIDGITSPGGLGGGAAPGGNPGPSTDHNGAQAPEVGLIVKYDESSGIWKDELGRNWNNAVRFSLPDKDVFAIDANTLTETAAHQHVGTVLYNMAVNPVNGNVYVSNQESPNQVRFEGPGVFGGSTVQGHLSEARITVIAGGSVKPRHVNPHIDYGVTPAPAGIKDHSLATLLDMAVTSDGATLYVAAWGSSKIGVFATADLENDALWDGSPPDYDPMTASASYIPVSGGGPGGLAIDGDDERLYVLTRFDNSVSVVDLDTATEVQHLALHNPEPPHVVQGRPFLYDALLTSSNGETSCSSCHIFGDMDDLAWDLGNPDDDVKTNPIPIRLDDAAALTGIQHNGTGNLDDFHPMKGPMTTQTLRGLVTHGAMHWRGDRSVGFFGTNAFDEDHSFRDFIVAFPGLVGRDGLLDPADMQKFADFQLDVVLPPNPIRNLDNARASDQLPGRNLQQGIDFFLGNVGAPSCIGCDDHRSDGVPGIGGGDLGGFTCQGCHRLDPAAGFFGTDGRASFENETQVMKIAHLRNLYQKVGMFGMPGVDFFLSGDNGFKGDQVRGFGFLHDGSVDTVFRFLRADVFDHQDLGLLGEVGFENDTQRRNVEAMLLAFDSDLAPIVGQQVTLDAGNGLTVQPRIDLMVQRASTAFSSAILGTGVNECDVIAKGTVGGQERGWVRQSNGDFLGSDGVTITQGALQGLASTEGPVTFTAVPPGSGTRMGVDRDEDGFLDELDVCPAAVTASQTDADADGLGDECDNCAAKANASQTDTDADAVGDLCDDLCVGETTAILQVGDPQPGGVYGAKAGAFVRLDATGRGPNAKVIVGGVEAQTMEASGDFFFEVPSGFPIGSFQLVELVNPEGCRSQEAFPTASIGITTGPLIHRCGLVGVEPLALVGLALWRRRRRGAR